MSISQTLANIGIQKKMWIMIGLIVFACLILFGVFFTAKRMELSVLNKDTTNLAKSRATDRLGRNLLEVRRLEKDFRLLRDQTLVDAHKQSGNAIKQDIRFLIDSSSEEENEKFVQPLLNSYETYEQQFELIANAYLEVGLNEEVGLQGSLRRSVRTVEGKLNEYNNLQLGYLMLMMRRHEKDFLMRLDEKYIARMNERKAEFEQALAEARLDATAKDEIGGLMASYHSDFELMAQGWITIRDQAALLDTHFEALPPLLAGLEGEINSAYEQSKVALEGIRSSSLMAMLIALVVAIVVTTVIARMIGGEMHHSISSLSSTMRSLADGDLETEVGFENRADEIGEMAKATATFKETAIQMERLREEEKERESLLAEEREKTHQATLERHRETHQLVEAFEAQVADILDVFQTQFDSLNKISHEMSGLAGDARDQNADISQASQTTTSKVGDAAESVDDMAASIAQIAMKVREAADMANGSVQEAKATTEIIRQLSEATSRIGDVVGIIHKIAGQTNLLALNATIESARAGEAGRGFAVVADEVKKLSSQTSNALDQIATQVKSVQDLTVKAVDAIRKVDDIIGNLDQLTETMAEGMSRQEETNRNIAENVREASSAVVQIAASIDNSKERADRIGDVSSDMVASAEAMDVQLGQLQKEISSFLASIDQERTLMGQINTKTLDLS
jgi:methyl-accepting chemotaxis protein